MIDDTTSTYQMFDANQFDTATYQMFDTNHFDSDYTYDDVPDDEKDEIINGVDHEAFILATSSLNNGDVDNTTKKNIISPRMVNQEENKSNMDFSPALAISSIVTPEKQSLTEKQGVTSISSSLGVEEYTSNETQRKDIIPSTPRLPSELDEIDLTPCSVLDENQDVPKEDPTLVWSPYLNQYFQQPPPPPPPPRQATDFIHQDSTKQQFHWISADSSPQEREFQDLITLKGNDQMTYEELSFSDRSAHSDHHQTHESYYSKDQWLQDRKFVRVPPSSASVSSETSSISMKEKPSLTFVESCMEQNMIMARDLTGLFSAECRHWALQAKQAANGVVMSAYHSLDDLADGIVMLVCPVESPVRPKKRKGKRRKETRRFAC